MVDLSAGSDGKPSVPMIEHPPSLVARPLHILFCIAGLGLTACSKSNAPPEPAQLPRTTHAGSPTTVTGQNLRSVWGAKDGDVWAVGDKGTAVHFDGEKWSASESDTDEDLTGVHGTAPNSVWATTQQGSVMHWDGSTWALASHVDNTTLLSVWTSGPNDVWAVGIDNSGGEGAGYIRHWNGAKWDSTGVPGSTSVWAVSGTGPKDIWIVGSTEMGVTGLVLRGDGAKFDVAGYGGTSARGVWGAASNDVWVAPYQGALQHWNGSAWTSAPTTAGPLLRVAGSASDEIWAVGYGGVTLHYHGGAWSTPPSGTTEVLWSVWSRGPNSAWAVGNGGTILRWNGTVWSR
jgi:hypothetical protein